MSRKPTATPLAPDDETEPPTHAESVLETPSPLADVEVKPAPTLITEQEVLFGTAAAVRPPSTRWWTPAIRVLAVILAVPARMFVTTALDARPTRRHYLPRYDFIEDARMAREIHRL